MRSIFLHALSACLAGGVLAQQPGEKKDPAAEPSAPPVLAPEGAPAKPALDAGAQARDRAAESFRLLPREYQLLVDEAFKRFQIRDFKGAISYVDKADQMQAPTVWTLNVRGAVAIEERRFEEGVRFCDTALKLDPGFFPAKFNLCEIPFLQGKYADARKAWEDLYHHYPVNPAFRKEDGTPELLIYRIFLCFVLEKDMANARVWMDKIPFPSVTPSYHYANAIWERAAGHEDKWKEWMSEAEFIWPENKRANFIDVLIQLGWMKPRNAAPAPEGRQ